MFRVKFVMCFILLGSLLASPFAIGQEPQKGGPPVEKPATQPDPAEEVRLKYVTEYDQALLSAPQLTGQTRTEFLGRVQTLDTFKNLDALETTFGLSLSDADDTLRAQLEIPHGVVVVGVKAGSLAEQAGLKVNDILLSLGDQKAESWGQVKQILLGLGQEALQVKLIREGKPSRMSLVGPKHGFPPEAAEFWIGTPVSPVDATLRAHLASIPADAGLVVNDVVKGSPADQVSIHKDDILIALDGKSLTNTDALIAAIQATQGKAAPLQVLRVGKPITLSITPVKRSHPTVINAKEFPGAPFTYQYQVVRPGMAIEVKPLPPQDPASQKPQAGPDGKIEVKHLLSGATLRVNPFPPNFQAPQAQKTSDFLVQIAANEAESTARIETQLKEILAKLGEINKTLEALKKTSEK